MTDRSAELLSLYDAAIAGAAPGEVTARAIDSLNIGRDRRVFLFAFGKAASGMADAAARTLLKSLHQIVGGVMVTPDGDRSAYPTVRALRGDHPLPGPASRQAGDRIAEVTAGCRATDVAIVLVSGGTSSLIASPLRGHAEKDLVDLYSLLLGAGLDIGEMNAVRKRFSRWGGGRLALALSPAATFCFAVSDVPGDDITAIGSGPCAPDHSTAADVEAILDRAGLARKLSPAFREYLAAVRRGVTPETPKRNHPAFAHVTSRVLATNRSALDAAAAAAIGRGMRVEIIEPLLSGSAALAGEAIARRLIAANGTRTGSPKVLIWGGETTVATGAVTNPADGGRCQELALAASRVLGTAGDQGRGVCLLAAGSDGRDGATEYAGAIVDSTTWAAMESAGGDPGNALARHQSSRALATAGALIPRRRTGTNVMDVAIGIVA